MIRINDLARELEIKSRQILDALPEVGIVRKVTHSSSVEDWEADKVREYFRDRSGVSAALPKERGHADTIEISDVRPAKPIPPPDLAAKRIEPQPFDPASNGEVQELLPVEELTLQLPDGFSFYTRGFVDFDHVLQHFDWNLRGRSLNIDLTACSRSNFQALALLLQYAWYSTLNECTVKFSMGRRNPVRPKC
jgi:Translation initiation factor IF-2, N-terminal region